MNNQPIPHAWTHLVLVEAADPGCGDRTSFSECRPSLEPGGALVWWTVDAWSAGERAAGDEELSIDGATAQLYLDRDSCRYLAVDGTGLDPRLVDRAAEVRYRGRGGFSERITGCFRDPGADEALAEFLAMLRSIDLPR